MRPLANTYVEIEAAYCASLRDIAITLSMSLTIQCLQYFDCLRGISEM